MARPARPLRREGHHATSIFEVSEVVLNPAAMSLPEIPLRLHDETVARSEDMERMKGVP
jgi:hypothetical protein